MVCIATLYEYINLVLFLFSYGLIGYIPGLELSYVLVSFERNTLPYCIIYYSSHLDKVSCIWWCKSPGPFETTRARASLPPICRNSRSTHQLSILPVSLFVLSEHWVAASARNGDDKRPISRRRFTFGRKTEATAQCIEQPNLRTENKSLQ